MKAICVDRDTCEPQTLDDVRGNLPVIIVGTDVVPAYRGPLQTQTPAPLSEQHGFAASRRALDESQLTVATRIEPIGQV